MLIAAITAIYTVVGGLRAVVITETIQTAVLLAWCGCHRDGAGTARGPPGPRDRQPRRASGRRSKPDQLQHAPHLERGQGFAWYAIFLGYPVLGIWYWCTDQTIVQRVLGARDVVEAQRGALFAGLLKITPVFIMVLAGCGGIRALSGCDWRRCGPNASRPDQSARPEWLQRVDRGIAPRRVDEHDCGRAQ